MKNSDNAGIIVVPQGYAQALAGAVTNPSAPASITYYVDPSQTTATGDDDLVRQRDAGDRQPRRQAGGDHEHADDDPDDTA